VRAEKYFRGATSRASKAFSQVLPPLKHVIPRQHLIESLLTMGKQKFHFSAVWNFFDDEIRCIPPSTCTTELNMHD
jgi:hypothetical protein